MRRKIGEEIEIDEVVVSRAITENFMREFLDNLEVDVAVVGAGPSGLAAAYYLALKGVKTVIYERQLRVGGGMPGGGMMFNTIVVQTAGKRLLDEFDVTTREYQPGYYLADSLETIYTMCSKTIKAGVKIFNMISAEDVVIRENDRVSGLVLNWSSVGLAGLHVDPLAMRAKVVIDASGHASEVCHIVCRKLGPRLNTATGGVVGEKPMWADVGEKALVPNTREVFPGLLVAGMAANAVYGSPRMGAIFGGMLLSGKRAAQIALKMVRGKAEGGND
jgi:sulfide-dependent adenosine diphosphate thiazole synthase